MNQTARRQTPFEAKPGFKLYRSQQGIDFPPRVYDELAYSFAEHTLFNTQNGRVRLLRRDQTNEIVSRSRTLSAIPTAHLVKAVFLSGKKCTKKYLSLPPARIGYRRTEDPNIRAINLVLDDKEGYLEEERDKYLNKLLKIGGLQVPLPEFIPEVLLGCVDGPAAATTDVLNLLVPHVPDMVNLYPVRANPSPSPRRRNLQA